MHRSYEGTNQGKKSKVDMLNTQYENFTKKEGESIYDIYTRFSSIIKQL